MESREVDLFKRLEEFERLASADLFDSNLGVFLTRIVEALKMVVVGQLADQGLELSLLSARFTMEESMTKEDKNNSARMMFYAFGDIVRRVVANMRMKLLSEVIEKFEEEEDISGGEHDPLYHARRILMATPNSADPVSWSSSPFSTNDRALTNASIKAYPEVPPILSTSRSNDNSALTSSAEDLFWNSQMDGIIKDELMESDHTELPNETQQLLNLMDRSNQSQSTATSANLTVKEEDLDFSILEEFSDPNVTASSGVAKIKAESGVVSDAVFDDSMTKAGSKGLGVNADTGLRPIRGMVLDARDAKSFSQLKRLNRNQCINIAGHPYECSICHTTFPMLAMLRNHENIHKRRPTFQTVKPPPVPITKHLEPRTFKCDLCEESFCEKKAHILHMETHAVHKCTHCTKSFHAEYMLKNHQRSMHKICPYQCDICGSVFSYYKGKEEHMEMFHSNKETSAQNIPKKCSLCGVTATELRKFPSNKWAAAQFVWIKSTGCSDDRATALLAEYKKRIGNKEDIRWCAAHFDKNGMPKQEVIKDYQCNKCDLRFETKQDLVQHMNVHNTGCAQRTFRCEVCGTRVSTNDKLTTHKQKAHGFSCEICHRLFENMQELVNHRNKH